MRVIRSSASAAWNASATRAVLPSSPPHCRLRVCSGLSFYLLLSQRSSFSRPVVVLLSALSDNVPNFPRAKRDVGWLAGLLTSSLSVVWIGGVDERRFDTTRRTLRAAVGSSLLCDGPSLARALISCTVWHHPLHALLYVALGSVVGSMSQSGNTAPQPALQASHGHVNAAEARQAQLNSAQHSLADPTPIPAVQRSTRSWTRCHNSLHPLTVSLYVTLLLHWYCYHCLLARPSPIMSTALVTPAAASADTATTPTTIVEPADSHPPVTWQQLDTAKDIDQLGCLSTVLAPNGPWYNRHLLIPHEAIRFDMLLMERILQPQYFQPRRTWKVKRFYKWSPHSLSHTASLPPLSLTVPYPNRCVVTAQQLISAGCWLISLLVRSRPSVCFC